MSATTSTTRLTDQGTIVHRNRSNRLVPAVLAITLAISAAGCGAAAEKVAEKAAEKAIESEGGGNADVNFDDSGQLEIKTDEGSMSVGSDEVPDAWPDDVPLPDGMVIGGSFSSAEGSNVTGTTDRPVEDVMAFYADALSAWTVSGEFESSSSGSISAGAQYELDGRIVALNVGSSEDATVVNITHTEQPAG